MQSTILISKATDIMRDEDGCIYAWRIKSSTQREFYSWSDFTRYIKKLRDLEDIVAFSGSSSLLSKANHFIEDERERRWS